jgi:phosphate transport system ATP-binding protein
MAILPPPRRRGQPTELAPEGVFNVAVDDPISPMADAPIASAAEVAVRARLDAIRREAQETARGRVGASPDVPLAPHLPPPPPPHLLSPAPASRTPPQQPPPRPLASVGVDPTAAWSPTAVIPPPHAFENPAPAVIQPVLPPPVLPTAVNGRAQEAHARNGHGQNGHANGHAYGNDAPTLFTSSVSATDPTIEIDVRDQLAGRGGNQQPSTLIAQNVSAWFGSRKVLERSSLDMRAGVVTALIGPSGCGKSTFLRILNRMHEVVPGAQMGGLVSLDGVDIYGDQMNSTEVRLRIGMVFQKPNPFPAMTIRENVLAGLKLSGTKSADPNQLVEASLRRAGLWNEVKDRLDQGGAALSGGQQQRLCIARALAVKPRVLLMDEPCSALDPISTRVIEETITELAHEITIVIVTHNMQQAQRVSDECAFFLVEDQGKPGRLIEAGPTTELFSNPRDQRTGDYVSGRFG